MRNDEIWSVTHFAATSEEPIGYQEVSLSQALRVNAHDPAVIYVIADLLAQEMPCEQRMTWGSDVTSAVIKRYEKSWLQV